MEKKKNLKKSKSLAERINLLEAKADFFEKIQKDMASTMMQLLKTVKQQNKTTMEFASTTSDILKKIKKKRVQKKKQDNTNSSLSYIG